MRPLDRWLAVRDLPRSELEPRPHARVARGVPYGALTGLDRISTGGVHHYFEGDELALVYIPHESVGPAEAAPLLADLGDGERLRSRAGPRSTLHVWADHGVAASVADGSVEFVEVYPPTTFEDYRSRIYAEPPPLAG